MTTPALRTIRQNLPDAEITLLVKPWVADVFAASPHVDHIKIYSEEHKDFCGKLRLGKELKKDRYDAAILLQNAFEAAFISLVAGIPIRAGYSTDGRGLLLSHPVRRPATIRTRHQVHYYQEMLKGLGFQPGDDQLELPLLEEDRRSAREGLGRLGVQAYHRLIGFNPGAAYGPAKRWPAERYGRLAAALLANGDNRVCIFGTDDDRGAAQTITELSGQSERVLDFTGKTSLGLAMALIERCHCFVTNDSGLMHVAAALQVPLVAVFGSTNHITTAPFSERAVIVRQELDCSPCLKTHCPEGHFRCMEEISVDAVLQAVLHQLDQGSR
jgi:heptosyltransferase-2